MKLNNLGKTVLLLCPLILLAGAADQCNVTNRIQKKNLVSSDFRITSNTPWENTLITLPPGQNKNCSLGKLVLSGGQNASQIYTRNLFLPSGFPSPAVNQIDTVTLEKKLNFPPWDKHGVGTDNQIIRLGNGSILAMRNGWTWSEMSPKPNWADFTIQDCDKGCRSSILFFKSDDCGGTWKTYSEIDIFKMDSKYARPRPWVNEAGSSHFAPKSDWSKYPSGAVYRIESAHDRPEIYRCPWTKNIYVTAQVSAADQSDQNTINAYHVYYSTDNGLSWKILGVINSASEAVVMTSTPNGRLILFQENGDTPQIYYTTKNAQGNPTLKGPYDVFGIKQGAKVLAQGTSKAIFDRLQVGTPSIMRLIPSSSNMSPNEPSSAVTVAYQAVNSYGNQVYELVVVGMNPNQSEKPTVYGSGQIESSDPKNYSVIHGTFIQPDYLDMPSYVATDMSMFYWIEAPQSKSQPFYAKYGLVSFNGYSVQFYLSTSKDSARKITPVPGIGDYLKGGFFWRDGRLNFVPQWAETDGIHANVVSVSPELLPKK